jgi:hypothetical protein
MRLLASALVAAFLVTAPAAAHAWGATRGDGQKVTQPREVADFTSVRLEGSLDAEVKVGGARSVSVTIDQNLQPLVLTEVSGGTLVVRSKDASWDGQGKVEITVPALRGFAVEGSGDVELTLDGGALSVSVAGSGDVVWHGQAVVEKVSVAGSGQVVRR